MSADSPASSEARTLKFELVPATGFGVAVAGVVIVGAAFGATMAKFAAELPKGTPPVVCLTRMRLETLGEFGTTIVSFPSFAVLDTSGDQVFPPSVERSMSTLPVTLVLVQVTAVLVPTVHVSPPFGANMLIAGCDVKYFAVR